MRLGSCAFASCLPFLPCAGAGAHATTAGAALTGAGAIASAPAATDAGPATDGLRSVTEVAARALVATAGGAAVEAVGTLSPASLRTVGTDDGAAAPADAASGASVREAGR